MIIKFFIGAMALTCLTVAYLGCASPSIDTDAGDLNTDPTSDTDADNDTDSDVDSDADADTDLDTDTDADSDADTGTEYPDMDSDGWVSEFDCDDDNPDANPGKEEIYDPANGVDEDCDGLTDEQPEPDPVGEGGIPETCEDARQIPSSVGCEFFAVDLVQAGIEEDALYGVAVANVQLDKDAKVVIEVKENGIWVEAAPPRTIAPLDLFQFELPNLVQDATGIKVGGAYRVKTDVPVAAYQFNPLKRSWSTDASLLYPVTALDTVNQVVMTAYRYHQYFTIAAARDDTTVEVSITDTVVRGPGIPIALAGDTFTIELDEGDVAQFKARGYRGDYTGTTLRTEDGHPIAVFVGDPCSNVPQDVGSCDHLEEQLSGLRRWGKSYVAANFPIRDPLPLAPEATAWVLYASADDTVVTITASKEVTGLPKSPFTMQRGDKLEFMAAGTREVPGDFGIESTKPIAVLGLMTGAGMLQGDDEIGDPSSVQFQSTEQFLPRYVILVPQGSWPTNHAVITRPKGVEVRIDGVPVEDKAFDGAVGDWEVGRIPIEKGVHDLQSEKPFGILIIGVGWSDSYGYLGGSGTMKINPDVQ